MLVDEVTLKEPWRHGCKSQTRARRGEAPAWGAQAPEGDALMRKANWHSTFQDWDREGRKTRGEKCPFSVYCHDLG